MTEKGTSDDPHPVAPRLLDYESPRRPSRPLKLIDLVAGVIVVGAVLIGCVGYPVLMLYAGAAGKSDTSDLGTRAAWMIGGGVILMTLIIVWAWKSRQNRDGSE